MAKNEAILGTRPDTLPVGEALEGLQRAALTSVALGAHEAFAADSVSLVLATT